MKAFRAIVVAIAVLLVSGLAAAPAGAAVSFSFFYSNLSPHGQWLVSAQYGRVWQPAVYRPGWNPYYDGHWVYADVGWTWVSDYAWGDVPYHYGTWYPDPVLGWVWVPGDVWAPAWVVFRTGPDYIGWAPVAPGFSVGAWFGSGASAGPFLYVSAGHFCEPGVRRYIVPGAQAAALAGRTRIVNNLTIENNIVVNRGPDPRAIERASGRHITTMNIESVPRVAPGGHFNRAALAAGPQSWWHGIRAAEPVSARQPLAESGGHARMYPHAAGVRVAAPPPAREARSQIHAAPPPHQHPTARPAPQSHVAHPAPQPRAPQPHASQPAPKGSQGHPSNGGKPHGGGSHEGHPHDR